MIFWLTRCRSDWHSFLISLLLLPAAASATYVEQCEMRLDGKTFATEIQARDAESVFPLRVT